MNPQLVRALLNPTRIRIMDAVAEGPASPSQLAAALEESPSVVSYHLGVLHATGCLQQTAASEAERSEERGYELVPHAKATKRMAQPRLEGPASGHPSAAVLRAIVDRGIASLEAGTPDGRRGDHLSYVSVVLDRPGWREVSAAIDDALQRVSLAHEESAKRLAAAEEEGISATIAVASFESSLVEAPLD